MSVQPVTEPRILFTPDKIQRRVLQMGSEIRDDLVDERDVLVLCVLKGAMFFCADLMRAMNMGARLDFIQVSSYGRGTKSSGEVRVLKEPQENMVGRTVLIVEDIIDTGLTLQWIHGYTQKRGAKQILTAAFLDKPTERKNTFQADYVGFQIDPHFVVGYGLDHAEQYRDRPEILVLPG